MATAIGAPVTVGVTVTADGNTLSDTVAMALKGTVFVTTTVKLRVVGAATFGALKLGVAVFAPASTTAGPPVWVQTKLKGCAGVFGSLLASALRPTS